MRDNEGRGRNRARREGGRQRREKRLGREADGWERHGEKVRGEQREERERE